MANINRPVHNQKKKMQSKGKTKSIVTVIINYMSGLCYCLIIACTPLGLASRCQDGAIIFRLNITTKKKMLKIFIQSKLFLCYGIDYNHLFRLTYKGAV